MYFKDKHLLQTRSLTPRSHKYRFPQPHKSIPERQPFTNLSSQIITPTQSLKPHLTRKSINTLRLSTSINARTHYQQCDTTRETDKSHKTMNTLNFCYVIFVYGDVQHELKSSATTVTSLEQELQNILPAKVKNKHFVLRTVDGQLSWDYYLSIGSSKMNPFWRKKLKLQPYFTEPQPIISLSSFDLLTCIGSGGFSKVFLVRFKANGQLYAMKVINKSFILKHNKQNLITNQRNTMVEIQHPMHAQLQWSFESKNSLILVMDYYPGGELFGLIKKYRKMSQNIARFYLVQILLALEKLHASGIAYRDIKPENILLDREGHVHLADFGLVKPGLRSDGSKTYSFCGSPEYMPPEVIGRKGHTTTADFYSLGALLYELLTGLPPFYNRDPQKIYHATLKEKVIVANHFSSTVKHLLEGLLCKQDEKRLGFKNGVTQILDHPWFSQIDRKCYLQRKIEAPIKFDKLQDLHWGEEQSQHNPLYLNHLKQQQNCDDFKRLFPNFTFSRTLQTNIKNQQGLDRIRSSVKMMARWRTKKQNSDSCRSKINNFL